MSINRPGDEGRLRDGVFGEIERAGKSGVEPAALSDQLEPVWGRADVARAVEELAAEGRVVEWNRRLIALRFTDWRIGTVQRMERGDALIRSGAAGEVGYFVRRKDLGAARNGDTVLLRMHRQRRRQRADLPRASVVRVLHRRVETLVGTLADEGGSRRLLPFDPRMRVDVEVRGARDVSDGEYVVVELDPETEASRGPLRGTVKELLGPVETPGVDTLVVLRHLGIPEEFPAPVLEATASYPADPAQEDWQGREDLREALTVTIDGESARDFDDAITVSKTAAGGFELGVHIADVSHYVAEGSELDLEAYRRGTSVYFPERAVPMLPEELSNGLCSLRPEVPRLALSALLEISKDGEIVGRRFAESVIRSDRRLTYSEVRRLLDEPREADREEYGRVLELLESARELMSLLLSVRVARGSIDFDLPEGDVILDTDGYTVGVRPGERNVAHRIVEEFMIAANEAVARELDGREAPALYRIHETPSPDRLSELREILRTLGIALEGDLRELHPSALQRVLKQVEGHTEEAFVSALVLRSMQRALYTPDCRGHYALSARYYTHFTSPIRRYPDLLVHRQLKASVLGRDPEEAERTFLAERLPAIGEHCSDTERRAERSERLILQWKLVRLLEERVGEEFDGRITGVQPFGLFVQLTEFFVDGLVPVRTLTDDFYVYDQERHRLEGRDSGRAFKLADPVRVVLDGVDARTRGLDLRVVGMPEPRPRPVGRRPRRPRRSSARRRR